MLALSWKKKGGGEKCGTVYKVEVEYVLSNI